MKKIVLIILSILINLSIYSQNEEKIKYRKLNYNDFTKHSINDTSAVVIDIFFDKKDNSAIGQMSFLPVTAAIAVIPTEFSPIGVGLSIIAAPFFINGCYLLVKYRNKKLYDVLVNYKETKELPKWLRKKVDKQLEAYELMKLEY